MKNTICKNDLTRFKRYLREQERSENTIEKYLRDVRKFSEYIGKNRLEKLLIIDYKTSLCEKYAAASINSMLAALNCFLGFIGRPDLRVKPLKIQRAIFTSEERELHKNEYADLVRAAEEQKNERLMLIIETICSTGIRVSELRFITVESVKTGRAEINCKGKRRAVFLPEGLRALLRDYIENQKTKSGAVFITRNGKPLDRSNIWRDIKKLCDSAEVSKEKVFPHNLRHLFARTFYESHKDLLRLADILGHSSINTTRVYTKENGSEHAKFISQLGLVLPATRNLQHN